jgi:hypothetical protein
MIMAQRRGVDTEPPAEYGAASAVFSIPELLDGVLLQLDRVTLLVAVQRVCRSWKQHMDASSVIQTYLFFRATEQSLSDEDVNFVPNPLMTKHFKHILNQDLAGQAPAVVDNASGFLLSSLMWPPSALGTSLDKIGYHDIGRVKRMGLSIAYMEDKPEKHERFVRREASWRKMLPSQPPPRTIGYVSLVEIGKVRGGLREGRKPPPRVGKVDIPGGLRMGQLWDTICRILWSPCLGPVETRFSHLLWRVGSRGDRPLLSARASPESNSCLNAAAADGVELLVAAVDLIHDEKSCRYCTLQGREYRCRNESWRNRRRQGDASTGWMFRSKAFDGRTLGMFSSLRNVPPDN